MFDDLLIKEDTQFAQENKTLLLVKNTDVLRKARSEALQFQDNDKSAIKDIELEMNKAIEENDAWIQKLSINPFVVMCWSKIQNRVLKWHANKNKNTVAFLDATGGLVKSPNKHPAFYYALTIAVQTHEKDPADPFPITDMISCSHTKDTIEEWLKSFRNYVEKDLKMWPIFKSVVEDFSFAEINAVLDAFNRIDIVKYLNVCYNLVTKFKDAKNLVKLHLCVSHFMHNMTADVNKYFKKKIKNLRILKEIVASLYLIASYDDIKTTWRELCVLMKCKFECLATENALSNIIQNSQIDSSFMESLETDEDYINYD